LPKYVVTAGELCYNIGCNGSRSAGEKGMEQMRIIAGEAGGRRLKSLPGRATRPTADRVKESLFGILGGQVVAAVFLDLYAGTGNIGIEALSRGADRAVFVDTSEPAVRIIRANLELTGYAERSEIFRLDVRQAITRLAGAARKFDLIFLDPPYETGLIMPALQAIDRSAILAPGGNAIAEHSRRETIDEAELPGLRIWRQGKYGDTMLTFLRGVGDNNGEDGDGESDCRLSR